MLSAACKWTVAHGVLARRNNLKKQMSTIRIWLYYIIHAYIFLYISRFFVCAFHAAKAPTAQHRVIACTTHANGKEHSANGRETLMANRASGRGIAHSDRARGAHLKRRARRRAHSDRAQLRGARASSSTTNGINCLILWRKNTCGGHEAWPRAVNKIWG